MTAVAQRSSGEIAIRGEGLTLDQVVAVAVQGAPVGLDRASVVPMAQSRAYVDRLLAEDQVVYGVTTGFGQFKDKHIGLDAVEALQRNLIVSHSAGAGDPLSTDEVRAIVLLRANALAKGVSGIRREVVDLMLAMLNRGVHPVIPCQGSVGASGDLAPLSHLALTLIGEGEAEFQGRVQPSAEALRAAGLAPVTLKAKEGLALVNGTQVMTGIGALAWHRAHRLAKLADVACAMTLEATLGSRRAFMSQLHRLRPHPGQLKSAQNLFALTEGSKLMESHRDCGRVQDAYSLRCAPQVHGASRDAIDYVARVVDVEANSANDNPLIFADQEEVINGGNFHGQPVALAMDFLAIALAEVANISERRVERLVNPTLSNGLPAFLTPNGGLNSGYMVAQYTAAALVSENKVLAHPACVDSIPTSANQEDHVSMGTIGARKARRVLEHAETVIAIELLCAAQGLDFRAPIPPAAAVAAAHRAVREAVPPLDEDRIVARDIDAALKLVRSGRLLDAVEAVVGELA